MAHEGEAVRDRQVRRVILVEGLANLSILATKTAVGVSTGSLAVLGDALHSMTDVANNFVAWMVLRMSAQPPDRKHPYGHRKFETLAVFVLATLLVVLGTELALRALRRTEPPSVGDAWALPLMAAVLVVNTVVSIWERRWAQRLRSDILDADARHTFADVLTTVAVIVGWQLSIRGHPWVDTVCALGVAALVFWLAVGLFRRAIPVLVDQTVLPAETVREVACAVPGVRGVGSVRSRSKGGDAAVDMVVFVDPQLTTSDAHAIVDEVEATLRERLSIDDATIHIEPDR